MKKLVFLFVGLLASIYLTVAQTQLQQGSDSSIKLKPTEAVQYQDAYIVITKEAGDTISVGQITEKFLGMKGLFHAKITKEHSQGIVFNGQVFTYVGSYQDKTEVVFAWFIIFSLISFVLMVISNFLFKKGFTTALVTTSVTILVTIFTVLVIPVFFPILTTAIGGATIATFIVLFVTFKEYEKTYWISSIVYYIFMLIFFISLFI